MKRLPMLVILLLVCININSTTETVTVKLEANGTPACGAPEGGCIQDPPPG